MSDHLPQDSSPDDPRGLSTHATTRRVLRWLVAQLPSRQVARIVHRIERVAPTGWSRRWDDAAAIVIEQGWSRVSVDVFDTVLLRRVLLDRHVHEITGAHLVRDGVWPGSAAEFATARRRAAPPVEAPSLADIYGEDSLAAVTSAPAAAAVETAVEQLVSAAAPGARDALDRLRRHGTTITFVSDMHLSATALRGMLVDLDLLRDEDRLWVSSELGRSKSSGTMFLSFEHPAEVIHVGDHAWSDQAMSNDNGIAALPLRSGLPTRAERTIGSAGVLGGAVASAARHARLGTRTHDETDAALAITGADVGGQLLAGFLLWVRQQCDLLDRRHVVFLARDGELPLRFARRMPADHWDGHRLSYLHANRRTWALAAADAVGVEEWIAAGRRTDRAFLDDKRHRVPLRSLLGRLGLTIDDVPGHLAGLDVEQPLPTDRAADWDALLADATVHRTIAERAADEAELVVGYLRTEGLLETPVVMVDVGWSGQLAWQMSAVVRAAGGADPVHLHVGGSGVATWLDGEVQIRRYVVDDTVAPLPYPQMVASVESLTATGAAPAVAFRRTPDGDVVPVFGDRDPAVDTPRRQRLQDAALAVADALPSRAELVGWGVDLSTCGHGASAPGPDRSADVPLSVAVAQMMTERWLDPPRADGVAASALGYEVDDRGRIVGRVAVPYTLGEFLPSRPRPSRQWRQGSLAVTPMPLRTLLRAMFAILDRRRAG